jgi:uncharacterized protein
MSNRLADSTSPYLLQHQHNPVDWYPWGPEALERARSEDRPILLSIGYSACHWCHVMERESFEVESTAALMNKHFVNIKVDREERPDLDGIYMQAVQQFTGGHGGWPMTVFLLPDGRPYYGGTYFPPTPRQGMPSFIQVMEHALRLLDQRRKEVESVSEDVLRYVRAGRLLPPAGDALSDGWLDGVAEQATSDFDSQHAGFGTAPKFPPHGTLSVLLAHHHKTGSARSLSMVTRTLDGMARGGMYDVIGGGFARYSVDAGWVIPHFEKMLYDNGLLLPLYVDAFRVTGNATYARVVRDSLAWLQREMLGKHGAFFASMDADSEGVEGKYFAWTPHEFASLLRPEDGARASSLLGVTKGGSFEHGTSVLRMDTALEDLPGEDQAFLRDDVFPTLLQARGERIPPGTDTKVVTAWNALAITAFARAGAVFGVPQWVTQAEATATFLLEVAQRDGRLLRSWRDGCGGAPGFADDHAFLVGALVDLYEATLDLVWLKRALTLADRTIELFWDTEDGGLFYTGHDAETLVARTKNLTGGALPSANGAAALAFVRLGALTGRTDLTEKADRILRSYQVLLKQAARALGPEALAGAWLSQGGQELGFVGAVDAPDTITLLREVRARYLPFAVRARVDDGQTSALLPWMEHRTAQDGKAAAYVCRDHSCLAPTAEPAVLASQLDALISTPADAEPESTARVRAPALPEGPEAWLGIEAPLSLEDLRGQVVVLDFWTYCCINCCHVLPELAAIEERFEDSPVTVIGVHSAKFTRERERVAVEQAMERLGVHHPVINDADRALWTQYAVKSWPTIVVLDATGREAWRHNGEVQRADLAAVIDDLLAEARGSGTLAEGMGHRGARAIEARAETELRGPGKVSVFPGIQDQSQGIDPLAASGRLYIADTGRHRILELLLEADDDGWPRGTLLRVFGGADEPGLADGSAAEARFREPQGMSRRGDELWVADTGNHCLRRVDLRDGMVTTAAGTGERGVGAAADPTAPRTVALRSPWDVETTDGAVLVAMAGTHQVWVYLPEQNQMGPMIGCGAEDHADGPASRAALAQPSGLALFGRHLFWADSETSSIRLADLEKREVMTVVGRGLFDFGDVDGPGAEVLLQHPLDLTFAEGVLWVADTFNHKIKRIEPTGGITTTLVGSDPSVLDEPGGIDVVGRFLVVADTNNHRIRVIDRETAEVRDLAWG